MRVSYYRKQLNGNENLAIVQGRALRSCSGVPVPGILPSMSHCHGPHGRLSQGRWNRFPSLIA